MWHKSKSVKMTKKSMCAGRDVKVTASVCKSKRVNHAWQLLDSGIAMDNVMILCRNLASSFLRWKCTYLNSYSFSFLRWKLRLEMRTGNSKTTKVKIIRILFFLFIKACVIHICGNTRHCRRGWSCMFGVLLDFCLSTWAFFFFLPPPAWNVHPSMLLLPYFLLSPLFGQDRPTSPASSWLLSHPPPLSPISISAVLNILCGRREEGVFLWSD